MSLESYLASSGVPMHDVRVHLGLEPLVRVELSAAVELVLQVAEDLFGRRVVQAVALAAHGLADAEASELVPPPLVLVLPSHVAVQDRLRARGRRSASMASRTGNGVLDRFLEDESLFGEFLRTPVSEGGVESLVVEPPHIVVEVGA